MSTVERELDFGQGRRAEAQLAMRAVLGRVEKESYAGSRLQAGVLREFASAEDASAYYRQALLDYLGAMGTGLREVQSSLASDDVVAPFGEAPPAAKEGREHDDTERYYAPWELMIVAGAVPRQALERGQAAAAGVVESCAEILRVLLGTAIVAASDDCAEDEGVVTYVRKLEFGHNVDLLNGNVVGMVRFQGIVYCSSEPRVSYLLGAAHGQPKPLQLAWQFPLVEQIYGPNRLRWCDMRSPGYEPAAEVAAEQKVVVPS